MMFGGDADHCEDGRLRNLRVPWKVESMSTEWLLISQEGLCSM
jgi:hypothetical protein